MIAPTVLSMGPTTAVITHADGTARYVPAVMYVSHDRWLGYTRSKWYLFASPPELSHTLKVKALPAIRYTWYDITHATPIPDDAIQALQDYVANDPEVIISKECGTFGRIFDGVFGDKLPPTNFEKYVAHVRADINPYTDWERFAANTLDDIEPVRPVPQLSSLLSNDIKLPSPRQAASTLAVQARRHTELNRLRGKKDQRSTAQLTAIILIVGLLGMGLAILYLADSGQLDLSVLGLAPNIPPQCTSESLQAAYPDGRSAAVAISVGELHCTRDQLRGQTGAIVKGILDNPDKHGLQIMIDKHYADKAAADEAARIAALQPGDKVPCPADAPADYTCIIGQDGDIVQIPPLSDDDVSMPTISPELDDLRKELIP